MTQEFLKSIVRHFLTIAAGYLVNKGVIESGQTEQLIGCGVFVAVVAWSFFEKRAAKAAEQKTTK